jgi:hypothetical protein
VLLLPTKLLLIRPRPPLPAVGSQCLSHIRIAELTTISGPAVDPTSSNTTSGPHSSDLANKADPRVDSDNDRAAGVGSTTSTTSGPHSSHAANKVDPRVDSDNSKTDTTGPIGGSSWMSTALPHREGKNTTSNTGVSGTTTQQPSHSQSKDSPVAGLEDITSQPPNVLPTNVPTGTSTDFGAPDSTPSAITGSSSGAATSSVPSSSTNTTTDTPVGSSVPSTTEPSHSLTGSRDPIAPTKPDHTNSPLKPAEKGGSHGVNPDAIPLAGGKKIGEDAYTERKSLQVDSIDAGLPATTSGNTARNVGTAEATGRPSTTLSEHEKSSVTSGSSQKEKSVTSSGGSGSEHKEKKGLVEKIKEKVHIHKHDK